MTTVKEIVPALLTPCIKPGEIDLPSLRTLCRYLYKEGATGLFAVSSTGEMPLMDERMRQAVIETAREETGPDHTLYVGVSGTGIDQTLHYIRSAANAGGQIAVIMAPFFIKLDQFQFIQYATRIADNSALPVAFYHHLRMPTQIDIDTIVALSNHSNIVGFKETSGSGERLQGLAEQLVRDDFRLLQGSELLVIDTLLQGGSGCVTALANIAPGLHKKLFDAFQSQQYEQAQRYQNALSALWQLFRLPGVERSFGHFVQCLKIPLVDAGIIRSAATLLPGFHPDADYQRRVLSFFHEWQSSDFTCSPVASAETQSGSESS